jgi:CDP-diacylglycerol--serine O-phosphatidyltransferase
VKPSRLRRDRPIRRIDLRKTLFLLPNLVTLASVFCGFNAILILSQPNVNSDSIGRAAILLLFAMLFDLLDGRVARMTKTQSSFGIELDSLADVISFGVAPALLVYKSSLRHFGDAGMLVAFLFVACGVVRLARFNVLAGAAKTESPKPGRNTVGLPIPPAAAGLIAIVVAQPRMPLEGSRDAYAQLSLGLTILLSLMMVSTIPFRSFKDLRLNMSTILLVTFAVGSSAFVWRHYSVHLVLVWLLSLYVIIGMLEAVRVLARRSRQSLVRQPVPPTEP